MSSYLALRFIERDDMDFFDEVHHEIIKSLLENQTVLVDSADDLDSALQKNMEKMQGKRVGLFLSGGIDSGILASYFPKGSKAYTFRFLDGKFQKEELYRAKFFAEKNQLDLQYVQIDWNSVDACLDVILKRKGSPVHSIEPQIYTAAMQAKSDGIEYIVTGEGADRIFGGLDKILSQDWTLDDFAKFFTYLSPEKVLKNPVSMNYIFERYRIDGDKIDFVKFMDEVFARESSGSYVNSFAIAGMKYFEPYSTLKLKSPFDLSRIRNGESKYLIRGLFARKYPDFPIPEKIPMPRPVDFYFKNWNGVKRPEFREDIDLSTLTGNQKWQLYCLERFLNLFEG